MKVGVLGSGDVSKALADGFAKHGHSRRHGDAGRLFDDRGNRMSPTHANNRGVRYRYYVSHAILQNRKADLPAIWWTRD